MKKFVKLSLVAAVAVAGLTTANAASLEEAIKGVDISGTAVLRYNDYQNDVTNASDSNNYSKLAVDLTAPVSEDITFGATLEVNSGFAAQDTQTEETTDDSVTLGALNFTFTGIDSTTVIVGKQAVNTPWTVAADSDGATHNGTGIVAVNTSTPVTLIGAYFNQTNFGQFKLSAQNTLSSTGTTVGNAGNSIAVVGAVANVAGVSLSALYADQIDFLESYTISADYKTEVEGVKIGLGARYSNLELDGAATDNELTKFYVKAAAGIFDASIAYGFTGKDGGLVAFDNSAQTAMEGWNTYLNGQLDADYVQAHVGAQVLPTVNVALNHFEVDGKTVTDDASETYTQITWKPSKNFYTYLRYGFDIEVAGVDQNRGRIQMEYKF